LDLDLDFFFLAPLVLGRFCVWLYCNQVF
jgi:hypothetical protein